MIYSTEGSQQAALACAQNGNRVNLSASQVTQFIRRGNEATNDVRQVDKTFERNDSTTLHTLLGIFQEGEWGAILTLMASIQFFFNGEIIFSIRLQNTSREYIYIFPERITMQELGGWGSSA